MFHSGYLGGRMKLWTVEGRKKLSGLLAKMGCVPPLSLPFLVPVFVERERLTPS